jgi:hypothetical protein
MSRTVNAVSRLVRVVTNRHIRARFWTVLVAFLIYLLWIWLLPLPPHWTALKATSEYVGYRVIDPDASTLRIGGMFGAVIADQSRNLGCVTAIVTPARSAWVEYRRGGKDQLTISIEPFGNGPAANLASSSDNGGPVVGKLQFTLDPSCSGVAPHRLPIGGPVAFGEELAQPGATGELPPGLLLKATVDVYALALRRFLMFTFPETVYSVMSFEAPPGVVICADIHEDQTLGEATKLPCPSRPISTSTPPDVAADSIVAWNGAAFASDSGFEINVSTNAPSLILQSTRTFGERMPTRRIDLGRHAQVLQDPNVLWLHLLGGLFLVFLQAGSWIVRLSGRRLDEKDELERET